MLGTVVGASSTVQLASFPVALAVVCGQKGLKLEEGNLGKFVRVAVGQANKNCIPS